MHVKRLIKVRVGAFYEYIFSLEHIYESADQNLGHKWKIYLNSDSLRFKKRTSQMNVLQNVSAETKDGGRTRMTEQEINPDYNKTSELWVILRFCERVRWRNAELKTVTIVSSPMIISDGGTEPLTATLNTCFTAGKVSVLSCRNTAVIVHRGLGLISNNLHSKCQKQQKGNWFTCQNWTCSLLFYQLWHV